MTILFNVGIAYEIEGEWFFRILGGPFKTQEEADKFASLVGLLEPEEVLPNPGSNLGQLLEISTQLQKLKDEAAPPPLGVNVSETIATKDKFG